MIKLTTHHDGCGLTELCAVAVEDNPHPVNGAHHEYNLRRIIGPDDAIDPRDPDIDPLTDELLGIGPSLPAGYVRFQRGPRNEPDSTPGTLDGALLAILIHRYECFQAGPFACSENAYVLAHLTKALDAIKSRARERATRNVLGTNKA